VLTILLAVSIGIGVYCDGNWGTARVQVVTHWVILCGLHLTLLVFAARIVRTAGISRSVFRVWTGIAITGSCYAAGDLVQLSLLASGQFDQEAMFGGTVQSTLLLAGTAIAVGALLTTPSGWSRRRRRAQHWLDVLIVLAAATAFGDYTTVAGPDRPALFVLALLTGPGLYLVGVLAIARAALAAISPITLAAGLVVGTAATLEAVLQAIFRLLIDQGQLSWFLGLTTFASTLFTAGARIQQLQVRSRRQPPRHAERQHGQPRGHFCALPYLALASTNLLLLHVLTTKNLDDRVWIIVAGSVISTSLVVARQLLASTDNWRLVQTLDATVSQLRQTMRERDELTTRLHHKAYHDPLTGLPNRALFTDRLHALCDQPGTGPVAVMLVDLDDFKPVNDTYGHGVGDQLLAEAAARMQECAGPNDLVARLGGDEFGILIQGPRSDVDELARQVLTAVSRPYMLATATASITASIGIAAADHAPDAQQLLTDADRAMYAAKHSVKGTYRVSHVRPARDTGRPARNPSQTQLPHTSAVGAHDRLTEPSLPQTCRGWPAIARILPWTGNQRYRIKRSCWVRPSPGSALNGEQPQRLR
jgi:diguanylate cyclase (GGDEF)-like protein